MTVATTGGVVAAAARCPDFIDIASWIDDSYHRLERKGQNQTLNNVGYL
jgi:hypothetical protein